MTILNDNKIYSSYSAIITYAVGNVVIYLNQLYKCKLISLNHLPTDTTYWNILITNGNKI